MVKLALLLTHGYPEPVTSQSRSSRAMSRKSGLELALLLGCSLWPLFGADYSPGGAPSTIPLRTDLAPDQRLTAHLANTNLGVALLMYQELTGLKLLPVTNGLSRTLDDMSGGRLSRWRILNPGPLPDSGLTFHGDGFYSVAEVKAHLENVFKTNGLVMVPAGKHGFHAVRLEDVGVTNGDQALGVQRFQARTYDWRVKVYTLLMVTAVFAGIVTVWVLGRILQGPKRRYF